MPRQKRRLRLYLIRGVLTALCIFTVFFIFLNSTVSSEASGAQSTAVADCLCRFLGGALWLETFVRENIRNIAHFSEFGALGFFFGPLVAMSDLKKSARLPVGILSGAAVAVADEHIQRYFGRVLDVWDMLIDLLGFTVLFIFSLTLTAFIKRRSNMRWLKSPASKKDP